MMTSKPEAFQKTAELPFSLELMSGQRIERLLIELAKIGGTRIPGSMELPERYSVNRVALSDEDFTARKFLTNIMKNVGAEHVVQHPLGMIGYYPGTDENLPSVIIESHFDSVPKAGMYDGTVGVMTGLEVLKVFKENDIKTKRSILMIAMTGEESSGFNMGLFGSRGIALGFTDEELNQSKPGGKTIRQALEAQGQSVDMTRTPYPLDRKSQVIEVHVGQDDRLLKSGVDLAIIENIAAPRRFQVTIGTSKLAIQKEPVFANSSYFSVQVEGKAGHSGATPMGSENRADGFVAMSDILIFSKEVQKRVKKELGEDIEFSIGGLSIEGQAMNKIPGVVSAQIRISATNQETVAFVENALMDFVTQKNTEYLRQPVFEKDPIRISKVTTDLKSEVYYSSEELLQRHVRVGEIVSSVNRISNEPQYVEAKNVGTVGTYRLEEGQIVLAIDIRGIDKTVRNEMVSKITDELSTLQEMNELRYEELAGSGDPVAMDPKLIDLAYRAIEENNIGRVVKDFSPAGHDSQNFARAGHPVVMIFIPSRNGGIAHTPGEYSTPDDLKKGAQALAALIYNLAIES